MVAQREKITSTEGPSGNLLQFFEHGPTVMYLAESSDPVRFRFVSANVESHFGYKPEEIVGDAGFRLATVHPEDKSNLLNGIDALTKARSLSQTYRIRHKDGTYRWVQDDLVLLRGRNGEKVEILGYLTDITAQKQGEEVLRESEQQFRNTFNRATIGMIIVGLGGQFQRVNQAFREFVGYSEKELLEKTIQDITHPDGWGATNNDRARLISGDDGNPTLEKKYIHKEGHEIWGLTSRSVIKDSLGNTLHTLGQIVDITDKKKASEELNRQKTLFEGIFRDVPDGMVLADTNRSIIMCNPALERILGYGSEELLGKQASIIYASREEYERQGRVRFNFNAKEKPEPYEVNYRRKNGEVFPGETVGTSIRDSQGNTLAFLGVIRDVTERNKADAALRESEERFRRSFEDARVGMALVDLEGRYLRVNRALTRMFGYAKREMVGKRPADFIHPDDRAKNERLRDQVTSGEKRSFTNENRYLHKKGHVIWTEINVSAIRNRRGEVLYTVGQLQDITKRRKAEDALRQSEKRLKDFASLEADRFWETDEHHRFTYLSTNVEKNLPPSFDDPIGKTRWERVGIDSSDEIWPRHRRDLEMRRPFRNFRYTQIIPSRGIRHFKTSGKPLFDEKGKFKGYRGTTHDETEAMEAKERAVDLQSRFHVAMENISEGFVLYDADDRFVACNSDFLETRPDLAKMLVPGVPYEDVIRQQAEFGHFPEAEGRLDEWVAGQIEKHHNPSSAYEILRDGRWYRVRKQKLADGSVISFHLEITEIKQREEELRESEEKFRSAFEKTAIGMALFDTDGRLSLVNEAFAKLLGYSISELLSKSPAEISHPEDREKTARMSSLILSGKSDSEHTEKRYIHKNGSEVWAMTSIALVRNALGEPASAVVQIQDITARKKAEQALKESEERFRSLFEKSAIGMVLAGRDARLSLVNNALCDFLGYSKEELERRTLWDITHPDDKKETLRHRERLLKGITDSHHWEKRYIHKDGRTLWGHSSTTLFRDAEGQPAGVAGVVQDITGVKETQRELVQASKLATLGGMAAGIAHELNQPLQIIRIAADHCLIKVEKGLEVDEAITSRLERIAGQTSRMSQIIDHMQVFGRVDSSESEPFDLVESINGAVKLIINELNLADIKISTMSPQTCRQVIGHSVQFEQVILNLLTNARDAIASKRQSGGGRNNTGHIEISVEDDRDLDCVRILVSDDGGTISNTVMERLFDPFFTTKDTGKGMGLGLSISYGIIDAMGGKIIAANTANGVKFSISLPVPSARSSSFPSIMG